MSSAARINFEARLEAVDRLSEARKELSRRFREPLINASVVFLAAATEAFLEDLYEEAAALIFSGMTAGEYKNLFEETSKRFHTASVAKTEFLYFHLDMEWAFKGLNWLGAMPACEPPAAGSTSFALLKIFEEQWCTTKR